MRLSHLTAVAVMIALVGAMFATLQTTSAGDLVLADGHTTGTIGVCGAPSGSAPNITPGAVTGITHDHDGVSTTDPVDILCPTGSLQGDWVRVTPTSDAPIVERLPLQVRINVTGDSDLVVPNDGSASLVATPAVSYNNTNSSTRNLWVKDDSFTVSGELGFHATGGIETGNVRVTDSNEDDTAWGEGTSPPSSVTTPGMTIPIRAGATEGEYTVSLVFLYDHDNDDPDNNGLKTVTNADDTAATKPKALVASKKITIADAGQAAASATLDFGQRTFDDGHTVADESREGAVFGPTNPADSVVRLKLSVENSLGNGPGGNSATALSSLFISASGAEITINEVTPTGRVGADVPIGTTGTHNASANIEGVHVSNFFINVAPIDDEPRSVSVSATVIGQDGSVARSGVLDLGFSGDSDSITVTNLGDTMFQYNMVAEGKSEAKTGDDADTNQLDAIALLLGAADSAGNGLAAPDVRVDVTDHEGKRVSRETIVSAQIDNPGSYTGNNSLLLLNNNASKAKRLGLGEYTVKVTNKVDATQTAEATFMVVGFANDVSVEVSNMTPSAIGDLIEVTVTVTDENGAPVADDTLVDISSSDAAAGSDHVLVETGDTGAQKTDDGAVSATFVAVGPGTAVITAVADGKSAVAVVTSTAGATTDAMADEEASVACLSNLNGFATWACGVESSASEIFGLVSGRGATALHLWNGSAWVRYSVVDGTMVPGSSDFMVAENDILYISN